MILQSGYDCWLTQSGNVPMAERVFVNHVVITSAEQVSLWKEIPNAEKQRMMAKSAIIDVNNITVESLENIEGIMGAIAENINSVSMTDNEAVAKTKFFPKWESFIGKELSEGMKVQHNGKLYQTSQTHTAQSDWTPDISVALFKVVQIESEGTEGDAIEWAKGMILENGKYYIDEGVKYLCIRDSVSPMYYQLTDLISGGYVDVVD